MNKFKVGDRVQILESHHKGHAHLMGVWTIKALEAGKAWLNQSKQTPVCVNFKFLEFADSSSLVIQDVEVVEVELVDDEETTSLDRPSPEELQDFCRDRAQKILDLERQIQVNRQQQGVYLLEVKDKLPHGQFQKWLKENFAWSDRTARNYMATAKTESVSVLETESKEA